MKKLTIIALLAGLAWWTLGPPDTEAVVLPDGSLNYPGYVFRNVESFTLEARVLSREDLLREVWNYRFVRESRTVDTYLHRLRQKLGDRGMFIKTVRGRGYKFDPGEKGAER